MGMVYDSQNKNVFSLCLNVLVASIGSCYASIIVPGLSVRPAGGTSIALAGTSVPGESSRLKYTVMHKKIAPFSLVK